MRMDPIKSYEDAAALFHTCRNHYKGKPLPANWRLHKDDSGLRPVYWIDTSRFGASQRLCSIHPDNTVQFHYSVDRLVRASNTIVMVLHKILTQLFTKAVLIQIVVLGESLIQQLVIIISRTNLFQ